MKIIDPVMKERLRRVKDTKIHDYYLGKQIQQELITLMGDKLRQTIIERIKSTKFFVVLLDCTPDIIHQQQMSHVIRFVSDGFSTSHPEEIKEHFIKFLTIEETTGDTLLDALLQEIKKLRVRLQGYTRVRL